MFSYTIQKAKRLTSKDANQNKLDFIDKIFDDVIVLKNEMSRFCYDNISELLATSDYDFSLHYKRWIHEYLTAHVIHTLFTDITKLYKNHVKRLIKNEIKHIRIQDKIQWSYYKKGPKKGRVRSASIQFKKSILCRVMAYLLKFSNLTMITTKSIDLLFEQNKAFHDTFHDWWAKKR